ncbi:Replicative DNA helicase [Novipirellula galeiformis]|uniref:DNA 5'-3' helicase n=1 Tax=Novipirellula galeiformis TaxID=2528004 RepID=A0A5C6CKG1_9BACT|nr:DnaB-like helicase C-terminal domain-containing protein [Novipirellula galeiformis]TWU24902.1 Replicative DNA helicase [Novipirellula galeiformis]
MSDHDHVAETEQCLLAAMISDPDTIQEVSAIVDANDLASYHHRRLWGIVTAMADANESTDDIRRLLSHVRETGLMEALGGPKSFAKRYVDNEVPANATAYALDVRRHSVSRQLKAIAKQFPDDIEAADDPIKVANIIRAKIDDVVAYASTTTDTMSLYEAALQRLQLIENPEASELGRLVPTGIPCLDESYGGLRCGGSYVIAARPGRGKSALLKQILNALDDSGRAALCVSLEMEPHEFASRVLSERAKIDGRLLEVDDTGRCPLDTDDLDRLRATVTDTQHSVLHIAAPKGKAATIEAISAQARLAKAKWGIEVLAVDYLQIMAKSSPRQTDYEFVTANSKAFKQLARELGIVVIVLSQLNRGGEAGGKARLPRLSDLRDSGAIEQDADGVIMLHQTKEGSADYLLIVAKMRNDSEGSFPVELVGKYTMFRSREVSR